MADFCRDCYPEVYGKPSRPGFNDLLGLCPPGKTEWAVCEGCGPGWFDSQGGRVRVG